MIFKGSRYEHTPIVTIVDADGVVRNAISMRFLGATTAGYQHTFSAGDRLDLIAYEYYGDPERFWLIADANPQMDAADLEVAGLAILIPPDAS